MARRSARVGGLSQGKCAKINLGMLINTSVPLRLSTVDAAAGAHNGLACGGNV